MIASAVKRPKRAVAVADFSNFAPSHDPPQCRLICAVDGDEMPTRASVHAPWLTFSRAGRCGAASAHRGQRRTTRCCSKSSSQDSDGSNAALRAAGSVGVISIACKALGLVREAGIAASFGVGQVTAINKNNTVSMKNMIIIIIFFGNFSAE